MILFGVFRSSLTIGFCSQREEIILQTFARCHYAVILLLLTLHFHGGVLGYPKIQKRELLPLKNGSVLEELLVMILPIYTVVIGKLFKKAIANYVLQMYYTQK